MKSKNFLQFAFTVITLFIFSSVLFFACEVEEPPAPGINNNSPGGDNTGGDNSGGSNSGSNDGYWKRVDGDAYLDIGSTTVKLCMPQIASETQYCTWTDNTTIECTLNGQSGFLFDLRKDGNQMKLSPITNNQTHDPAWYSISSSFPCEGSGGGGGGGGGSTDGQIMVWTSQDWQCGSIDVSIDGSYYGQITSYYYTGQPDCGASGCVTKTVSPGYHSIYAECSSYNWSGSNYYVESGECYTVHLGNKGGKPAITIWKLDELNHDAEQLQPYLDRLTNKLQ